MSAISPEAKEAAQVISAYLFRDTPQVHTSIEWAVQDAIDSSRPKPKWIKCVDRLPTKRDADRAGEVWWYNYSTRMVIKGWFRAVRKDDLGSFTHWMPCERRPDAP